MADALHPPTPVRPLRRGWFVSRILARPLTVRQHPAALRAAARIVTALPLLQVALLVGVLKAEPWQALLGAEGLVIAWLAGSQLRRQTVEGRLAGYGMAVLNTVAMGAAGLALGGHLLWLTGAIAMAVVTWLVFAPTGAHTVRRGWVALALLLGPLVLLCAAMRWAVESSATQTDAGMRRQQLTLAWAGYQLRGGTGTERALLRLRQAQAAFEVGDYHEAFELANNGAFDGTGRSRVPATAIGADLLDSLLRVKAQSLYNSTWNKDDEIRTTIRTAPLAPGLLELEEVPLRWAW